MNPGRASRSKHLRTGPCLSRSEEARKIDPCIRQDVAAVPSGNAAGYHQVIVLAMSYWWGPRALEYLFPDGPRPPGRLCAEGGTSATREAFHRCASVENMTATRSRSISRRVHGADHHVPVENPGAVRHLPELDVFLQRQAGESPAGGRGARGPVRAGGKRTEIQQPDPDQRQLIDAIPGQHVWANRTIAT